MTYRLQVARTAARQLAEQLPEAVTTVTESVSACALSKPARTSPLR